jgi:hypothetical protein
VDQDITSTSALQVRFTGILLREQAVVCRLFRPDLSTYQGCYARSRGYVRQSTESTQEYYVSEPLLDMLKMAIQRLATI